MPVERIKAQEVPQSRFQTSPLYDTPEWKETVAEIGRGLAPMESLRVAFTEETIAKLPLRDPVRAFVVALRRLIRQKRLPIDVTTRARAGEKDVLDVYVVGRAPNVG
jgi:hypothetical protein